MADEIPLFHMGENESSIKVKNLLKTDKILAKLSESDTADQYENNLLAPGFYTKEMIVGATIGENIAGAK